jgi:hypothetical protein
MNRHYYIIAGTLDEAIQWVNTKQSGVLAPPSYTHPLYLYVSDPSQIDNENPDGIFIGSWKKRQDLPEIFLRLTNKIPYGTDKLTKIIDLWDSVKNNL